MTDCFNCRVSEYTPYSIWTMILEGIADISGNYKRYTKRHKSQGYRKAVWGDLVVGTSERAQSLSSNLFTPKENVLGMGKCKVPKEK